MLEFVLIYLYGEQESQLDFRKGSVVQGETLSDQRILAQVCFLVACDDLLSFLVQYVVTLRT